MATFSTWAAALTAIKNEIADGNFRVGSVTVGGKQINYRTPEALFQTYERVKFLAAEEAGTVVRRVYAKQGGRG
jgi:hypothetical protein